MFLVWPETHRFPFRFRPGSPPRPRNKGEFEENDDNEEDSIPGVSGQTIVLSTAFGWPWRERNSELSLRSPVRTEITSGPGAFKPRPEQLVHANELVALTGKVIE